MSLATTLGLQSGDKIVFGGDSITTANNGSNMYAHYFAAWLHLTYPDLNLNTYVNGGSGTTLVQWWGAAPPLTAPDSSLFEKHLYPLAPDVVFLMHGQNGGQSAVQHGATYADLWTDWVDGVSSSKLVCLGMHPVQDETDSKYAEGKADEEAALAATSASIFASHTFDWMGEEWIANNANTVDVQQIGAEPFDPAPPTDPYVHPGPAGHIVLFWSLLQGLGAETVVSKATINAATATETTSDNCTISNITGNSTGIAFDRIDGSLPWAIDEAGRTNADLFATTYTTLNGGAAITDWQDYSITVTGLVAGTYEIFCDSVKIGETDETVLAAGWNMAGLTVGPVWEQCQSVLDAIRVLHGFDPDDGTELGGAFNTGTIGDYRDSMQSNYVTNGYRGITYYNSMQSAVTGMDTYMAAVRTAANPVTRTYAITYKGTPPSLTPTFSVTNHITPA